jgi:hypothetical protein
MALRRVRATVQNKVSALLRCCCGSLRARHWAWPTECARLRDHSTLTPNHPNAYQPRTLRYKPGLVATEPGALLEMAVDIAGARQPSFVLQYLRSYVGHGIAEISCAGGCACDAQRVDSHNPRDQTSILDMLNLPVTSADGMCLLRLRVLNATSSGAHKFKLARMIVEQAPRRRRRLRVVR